MNRRIFSAVLAVILLCVFPLAASAQQTVQIPQLQLNFTLDDSWLVLTRSTPKNDPALAQLGIPHQYLMEYFNKQNIYFNAVQPEQNLEMALYVHQDEHSDATENLLHLSDENFRLYIEGIRQLYQNKGYTVPEEPTMYKHPQMVFCDITLYTPLGNSNSCSSRILVTISNQKTLVFELTSLNGSIGPEANQQFEQAIQSIKIAKGLSSSPYSPQIPPTLQTQPEISLSLLLPLIIFSSLALLLAVVIIVLFRKRLK